MNLRKALDRAKKEREMNDDAAVTITAKSAPNTGAGWQPPRYSESRNVAIDISTAVRNHCVAFSTEFAEVNYYKVLRTQLRQISQNKNWNTVMVTSASPNEGKTVTSINLAATFAREYNHTVLLVDADNDGDLEAVVATHYRVMVFDAATGRKDATGRRQRHVPRQRHPRPQGAP